jgi:hypothetical protein
MKFGHARANGDHDGPLPDCHAAHMSIWNAPALVQRMSDRLRVGMLAPVAWRIPPLHCGLWERVVSILIEGLVARVRRHAVRHGRQPEPAWWPWHSGVMPKTRRSTPRCTNVYTSPRPSSRRPRAHSTSCTTTSTLFRVRLLDQPFRVGIHIVDLDLATLAAPLGETRLAPAQLLGDEHDLATSGNLDEVLRAWTGDTGWRALDAAAAADDDAQDGRAPAGLDDRPAGAGGQSRRWLPGSLRQPDQHARTRGRPA